MVRAFLPTMLMVAAGLPAATFDQLEPVTDPQPPGALAGASVFVSAGHGWLPGKTPGVWNTQRGVSHGLIEDHSNAEAVNQFLIPYLWNAGARVYSARERDMNTNMVIVEAGSRGAELEGPWSVWRGPATWKDSCYWAPTVTGEPTATATFTPEIPEDGFYAVYAWYRSAPPTARGGDGRLATQADARFQINHTGGTTVWTQDLARDGGTWTYLGHYYFEKGNDAARGSVVVTNQSASGDSAVVVDAIRFGGGMGDSLVEGKTSGKPRWEESGMFYATFAGFNPENDTRSFGSVSAMPMWAEWECEDWELGRSVYVSWHTNASNGRARGLSSFVYGPNAWEGLDYFIGHPKGRELQEVVHNAVITSARTQWPEWPDYGRITRWLGEVNPRNNNRMPAALFEYGYHDNPEDAAMILDPRFRDLMARATMEGIATYFNQHVPGFSVSTRLPDPPVAFSAIAEGEGVRLRWEPSSKGDAATQYRVRTSTNGYGFDNGGLTATTSVLLPSPPAGETRFYRVSARNAGGESFPSEVLAVRTPREGEIRVLIVNGFDRLDRGMNLPTPNSGERGFIARMNSRDYTVQHAQALGGAGFAFDAVSNEAATGAILANYHTVVWILGQEAGADEAFSSAERGLLGAHLQQERGLIISGTEWARDLATTETGRSFLASLGIAGATAHDASADIRPMMGASQFTEFPPLPFERSNTGRVYTVRVASGLTPAEGATALMQFGESGPAAVVAKDRVVTLGVPFETLLAEKEQRAALMGALIKKTLP